MFEKVRFRLRRFKRNHNSRRRFTAHKKHYSKMVRSEQKRQVALYDLLKK